MDLTRLDGTLVMCVLIIPGKRARATIKLKIDQSEKIIGLEINEDF